MAFDLNVHRPCYILHSRSQAARILNFHPLKTCLGHLHFIYAKLGKT